MWWGRVFRWRLLLRKKTQGVLLKILSQIIKPLWSPNLFVSFMERPLGETLPEIDNCLTECVLFSHLCICKTVFSPMFFQSTLCFVGVCWLKECFSEVSERKGSLPSYSSCSRDTCRVPVSFCGVSSPVSASSNIVSIVIVFVKDTVKVLVFVR